jgi:hypothetical protein
MTGVSFPISRNPFKTASESFLIGIEELNLGSWLTKGNITISFKARGRLPRERWPKFSEMVVSDEDVGPLGGESASAFR